MSSLIKLNEALASPTADALPQAQPSIPAPSPEAPGAEEWAAKFEEPPATDYEIVFGPRQIASLGVVLMAVLAIFSGVSYLIGKSSASKAGAAAATEHAIPPPPAPSVPPVQVAESAKPKPLAERVTEPVPEPVKVAAPKESAAPKAPAISSPLFGQQITGQTYLQAGVVEKGPATVWAEGLRVHGLEAFVAPGPTETSWRVLIGPLATPEAYKKAKATLDSIGMTVFAREGHP